MSFIVKDLQNTALVLSPTKNIISIKIGLEYILAAYWLMGFNCIFSIVNNTAEKCILLPDNRESAVQGIKEQYSENKRKYYFLQ